MPRACWLQGLAGGSQITAASRSNKWQEGAAGPSNVRGLLLSLLGGAGFGALWCHSLLAQAGLCVGQWEVFQGIGIQLEFWRCKMRKACEVRMVHVGKEE